MDLIVALPPTLDGNTSLVVFVDKLTKMIHIAPCVGLSSAPALADLFIRCVPISWHACKGLLVIVSDSIRFLERIL
jgi:hypothetical protein